MLQPIGDRLVVEPVRVERIGSIIAGRVPPPVQGVVLAVGPGAWARKRDKRTGEHRFLVPDVQVGDRVLYSQFRGEDITLAGGRSAKVLAECDVMAVLGPDATFEGMQELTL